MRFERELCELKVEDVSHLLAVREIVLGDLFTLKSVPKEFKGKNIMQR